MATSIIPTRWVSTGTTKTSWSLIQGDTGWRDLSANLNTTLVTGGVLWSRQINNSATLWLKSFSLSATGGTITSTNLPAPWDGSGATQGSAVITRSNGIFGVLSPNGGGSWVINGGAVTVGMNAIVRIEGIRTWPSVLPGTAAGG